jgi:hypothetical protein
VLAKEKGTGNAEISAVQVRGGGRTAAHTHTQTELVPAVSPERLCAKWQAGLMGQSRVAAGTRLC